MLKTILASSAIATLIAAGAVAQSTDEPATGTETAPMPEATADATAPATDGAASESADQTEMAEPADDAVMPAPESETAQPAEEVMPEADGTEVTADEPADMAPDMADREGWTLDEGWQRVDLTTFSADELLGTDIVNGNDETVAEIDDVILADDGQIENVVAQFGGFLGFGTNKVLLTMDEIDVVQDPDGALRVRTNLTPDALEGRPEYQEEAVQG